MKNATPAAAIFQRKIFEFCDLRLKPLITSRELENIKPYLASLLLYRKPAPRRNGRIDWGSVVAACGMETELNTALKKNLQIGFEAIERWIKDNPVQQQKILQDNPRTDPVNRTATVGRRARKAGSHEAATAIEHSKQKAKPGVPPKPVEEFPAPLFEAAEDPPQFQDALAYQMRRHGDSSWHLYRAVVRESEAFDRKTIFSWLNGSKAPL